MNPRMQKEFMLKQQLDRQRAGRLSRWASGEQPGPFKVTYFPTNRCNLKCEICWQRQEVHDYSDLTPSRQLQLVDEAFQLDVREFVIGGGGEPLCSWKTMSKVTERVKAYGMYGLLFTNGTLLTPTVASHLVELNWDKVLVSIDAASRETNDVIRGEGAYQRIMAGLDNLLQARGDASRPIVGIGCALTRQGMRELPDLVRMIGERGCDQLNLIRLVVYQPSQRRFALCEEDLAALSAIIEDSLEIANEWGMMTNLGDYLDQGVVQRIEEFDKVLLSSRTRAQATSSFWDAVCFEPFTNVVIHANGLVGSCCMSGDDPVASVVERTLEDVWYGAEFSALRKGIRNRELAPYCRICDINVFQDNQRLREIGSRL